MLDERAVAGVALDVAPEVGHADADDPAGREHAAALGQHLQSRPRAVKCSSTCSRKHRLGGAVGERQPLRQVPVQVRRPSRGRRRSPSRADGARPSRGAAAAGVRSQPAAPPCRRSSGASSRGAAHLCRLAAARSVDTRRSRAGGRAALERRACAQPRVRRDSANLSHALTVSYRPRRCTTSPSSSSRTTRRTGCPRCLPTVLARSGRSRSTSSSSTTARRARRVISSSATFRGARVIVCREPWLCPREQRGAATQSTHARSCS